MDNLQTISDEQLADAFDDLINLLDTLNDSQGFVTFTLVMSPREAE